MKSLNPVDPLEPIEDLASQRAAEFLEQRRFGEWDQVDQAELDEWLAESILHHAAFLRVEAIAARADRLAALNLLERKQASLRTGPRAPYHRFVLPFLAAASLTAATFWGAPFAASLMASWLAPPDRTDTTDVGGRTLLRFADHTEIELNTATGVRLRMTNKERTVWLEKGEAWFQVAHDAAHPFTVIVGTHRVTDIGTEFLVRRDGDNVDVTLLNGRAAVSSDGTQTATLNPGEEAVATPNSLSISRKTPQELADELAWQRGMLVFRNTPLAKVVREFNRYNATKLIIADPSIAGETVTADIRTDAFQDFLGLAETTLGLRVDHRGNEFLIYRDERGQTKRAAHGKREP